MKGTLWFRLWRKVEIGRPEECWPWTGAYAGKRVRKGWQLRRPSVRLGGRKTPAVNPARLICEWFRGPAPSTLHEAGHTCPMGENERCVNPHHLAWMTRLENEQYKRRRVEDGKQHVLESNRLDQRQVNQDQEDGTCPRRTTVDGGTPSVSA